MNKSLVSVIIPCYNAEKYVEKAIRSILGQTYKNIEVLIVDDASTDTTIDIIEMLAREDCRIRLIKHQSNKQIVYTLNELINAARGEYIARMDADDISLPQRIEKQVFFLETHKDYAVCGTNLIDIDEEGNKIGIENFPAYANDTEFIAKFYTPVCHPSVMFRADVCENNKYDPKYIYAEDYELWCRMIFENGLKIGNVQEQLFMYRKSSNQICAVHFGKQQELVRKIYKNYHVVPQNFMKCHEEVFLKLNQESSEIDLKKYIKYCYELSICQSKNTAVPIISALLSFCLKKRFFFLFLNILFSSYGSVAVVKKVKDMIPGR